MSKFLALTKVLLKNNVFGGISSKSKKSKYGTSIVVALLILFVVGSVCVPMTYVISSLLEVAKIEKILISLIIPLGGVAVIIFSLFSTISVFCLNKDSDYLLPMPLPARDIILSKFIVSLITQYYILLMFILPCLIGVGIGIDASAMYYVYMTVIFVFLPVIPSSLVTILVLVITRFTGVIKNKDVFMYFSMVLILLFSFGYNYILQNVLVIDPANIGSTMESLENALLPACNKIFPFYNSASDALINFDNLNGLFSLITFIGFNFVALLLVYLIGDKLYLRILTDNRGSKKKIKNIENKDIKCVKGNKVSWLLKKEWLIIKRTPIFMLNIVAIVFIMPIIIVFSFVISSGSEGSSFLLNIGDVSLYLKDSLIYIIVLAICIFFTCTSVAASTAISREGSNAWFMKVIPVSYFKQINVKVLFAVIIDMLGVIFTMVLPVIIYKIPVSYILLVLIPLTLIVTIMNYFNILVDLKKPVLKWSEESEAVKQNVNSLISIFGTMGLCALFGVGAYLIYKYDIVINVILLSILISVFCVIILGLVIYYFYKNSDKLMKNID